uniref:(northern house mosquito) hypothetical protein n=1 Tax=Culex pipiens TaxID=7175 RepID=A0A8D8G9H1_CULPI
MPMKPPLPSPASSALLMSMSKIVPTSNMTYYGMVRLHPGKRDYLSGQCRFWSRPSRALKAAHNTKVWDFSMSPAALVDMDNVVRHGPLVGLNTGDQTVLSACRGQQYGKNRTAKDFSLSEKLNDHHGSRIHQNVNSASRNSQNVVGKLPEPVSVARECPTGSGVELVNMHVRCGSPCEASTSSRLLPAP